MARQKESAENILKRVKRYRKNKERLEITGLTPEMKAAFISLPGLDNKSYSEKLGALINHWNNFTITLPLPVTIDNKASYSDSTIPVPSIDWYKFDKDFISFLDNFKISNRTRDKLRTAGNRIRQALDTNPEYREAFTQICSKLPGNVLKLFRPMYTQGYFYLYEKEIIEISHQESNDKMLLVLFESLRHMGRDEPVKEAKKVLGLND